MASELHSRLEYLINYSSQLIFVSGDSIAEQQRSLESFVFQQSDNTELAFVTAEPALTITDYRGALCKQLLGQVVGSYVRPLNELLAGLNHHDGPVLITITQAQHIPDAFLQELWDLVLQSRFANNKQHLNVLLFGDTDWAEEAKEWLPAKNTSTPLLISSQSVSGSQYGSELDRMLAEKRASYEQYRREKGALSTTSSGSNRLRSPWLWLGICLLFVSSFVAILGWQYGSSLSTLFNPIETASKEAEASSQPPQATTPTRSVSIVKQDGAETVESAAPAANTSYDAATASAIDNDQARVIDSFSAAIKTIPTATNSPNKPDASVSEISAKAETADAPAETASTSPVTAEKPATVAPQGNTEQTANNTQPEETTDSVLADLPANTPMGSTAEANPETQASSPSLTVSDGSFLASENANYWLQIAGLQDPQLAATYLSDNNLNDRVHVYQTQRYGGDWYVIIWSEPAPTLQAARQRLADLPSFPGSDNAFIKRKAQIAQELK